MKRQTTTRSRCAALAAAVALSSCSSIPDAVTNAVTGGAGAYLGHELAGGESGGALLGAATGVVAGSLLNGSHKSAREKAFRSGYDHGRNDEVKRLYWVRKSLHRDDDFAQATGLNPSLYEIPVPGHVASDGTLIEPHTQIIETLEP